MGGRTRTFSGKVDPQIPGKNERWAGFQLYLQSITWCIFGWSLTKVDFYTINHFEETT